MSTGKHVPAGKEPTGRSPERPAEDAVTPHPDKPAGADGATDDTASLVRRLRRYGDRLPGDFRYDRDEANTRR